MSVVVVRDGRRTTQLVPFNREKINGLVVMPVLVDAGQAVHAALIEFAQARQLPPSRHPRDGISDRRLSSIRVGPVSGAAYQEAERSGDDHGVHRSFSSARWSSA